MEHVYRAYPEDREAAIFYALALNTTALPTDKTYANQLQAAAILDKVFAEQPQHPGVAHYLIHSYDYPPIAGHGLPSANRYAGIAPAVPHALHMPSHIFTRVGDWRRLDRVQPRFGRCGHEPLDRLHAMDYLTYGYLQLAQDGAARGVLDEIATLPNLAGRRPSSPAYALAAMPARYALERGRWSDAASLTPSPSEGLGADSTGGGDHGVSPGRSVPRAAAMSRARGRVSSGWRRCATRWSRPTRPTGRSRWTSSASWRSPGARARKAGTTRRWRSCAPRPTARTRPSKHPVTPGPIVPARELLGELLLELGQPAQALEAFERSHRAEPNGSGDCTARRGLPSCWATARRRARTTPRSWSWPRRPTPSGRSCSRPGRSSRATAPPPFMTRGRSEEQ